MPNGSPIRRNHSHGRVFRRLVLSFIAAALVPSAILGFAVYDLALRSARDGVVKLNEDLIRRAATAFDAEIVRMQETAAAVDGDIEIRYPNIPRDLVHIARIQQRLRRITEISRFVEEIILVPNDPSYSYSDQRTYPLSSLRDLYFPSDMELYVLRVYLGSLNSNEFIFPDSDTLARSRTLVYAVPIDTGSSRSSVVLFVIPYASAQSVLRGTGGGSEGHIQVVSQTGAVVYDTAPTESAIALPDGLEAGKPASVVAASVDGPRFTTTLQSGVSNLFYTREIVSPETLTSIRASLAGAGILGLIAMLVVGGVIWTAMRINYLPILRTVRLVDSLMPSRETGSGDEVEGIERAISSLYEERDQLLHSGEANERRIAEQELIGAASATGDDGSVVARARDLGFAAEDSLYVGFALAAPGAVGARIAAGVVTVIRERLQGEFVFALGQATDTGTVHGFAEITRGSTDKLLRAMDDISQQLAETNQAAAAALGRVYASIQLAGVSIAEAEFALRYRIERTPTRVVEFDSLRLHDDAPTTGGRQALAEFSGSLAAGNPSQAALCVAVVFSSLRNERASIFTARAIAYELVARFFRYMERPELRDLIRENPRELGQIAFVDYSSIDDLEQRLQRALTLIAERVKSSPSRAGEERRVEIVDYITQHVLDPALSVEMVRSEFGVSQTTVSAAFRKETGESISDFVTRTRIDKACNLLESGMSVKEVVRAVGYSDATSFIRKFHKVVGVTPGEYRTR